MKRNLNKQGNFDGEEWNENEFIDLKIISSRQNLHRGNNPKSIWFYILRVPSQESHWLEEEGKNSTHKEEKTPGS